MRMLLGPIVPAGYSMFQASHFSAQTLLKHQHSLMAFTPALTSLPDDRHSDVCSRDLC